MNHWDKAPLTVTPVAALLAKLVDRGTVSQEELDAISRDSSVSDSLFPLSQETEQHLKMKRRLDELQMELEMLRLEKDTADVSHKFYLSQRLEVVQRFSSHLQEVLKAQSSLRQRLMRPMHQTNLPIQADLHRYVVELISMVVDFIENLDRNLEIVRSVPTVDQSMVQLNTAVVQLLDQVSEVEGLSKQVLQWKEHRSSMLSLSSASAT